MFCPYLSTWAELSALSRMLHVARARLVKATTCHHLIRDLISLPPALSSKGLAWRSLTLHARKEKTSFHRSRSPPKSSSFFLVSAANKLCLSSLSSLLFLLLLILFTSQIVLSACLDPFYKLFTSSSNPFGTMRFFTQAAALAALAKLALAQGTLVSGSHLQIIIIQY